MKPSTYMKKFRSCSINDLAEGGICDASHDPIDEGVGEASLEKVELNVGPACAIKILCEVNLEDGAFNTFELDRVQGFLGSTYGFMNLSLAKEGKLFLGYVQI